MYKYVHFSFMFKLQFTAIASLRVIRRKVRGLFPARKVRSGLAFPFDTHSTFYQILEQWQI